jgi:hypothetical protein
MTDPTPTPGAPMPPDTDRAELAELLAELANALRLNVPQAWDWPIPTGVTILHDRARAAAERLGGGDADG